MRHVIPFGNRILVRRHRVGEKVGAIILTEQAANTPTDLATVAYVPDLTFCDKAILDNAEKIVKAIVKLATDGNSYAVNTLLEFNNFCKMKSLKVGDKVMVSKYQGMDFDATDQKETLTLLLVDDIIGLVVER